MKDLNIKIKLSHHQTSIMNDEITTALLAFIEKSGTTNEEEITSSTGISKETINKVLLKLYKNNLIKYGKKYLVISGDGKKIIDRLGVEKDIVEVNLDEFDFDVDLKNNLTEFLVMSRNLIYPEYLKTITDLRIWNSISMPETRKTPKVKFERRIGALCHINRLYLTVLYNMASHDVINKTTLHDPDKFFATSIKEIINHVEIDNKSKTESKYFVLNWLNDIYEIDSKRKFKQETKEKNLKNLFISYSLPRYRVDYDNWCSVYFNKFNYSNQKSNVARFISKYDGSEYNIKSLILNTEKVRFKTSNRYLKSFSDTMDMLSICRNKIELSNFLGTDEPEIDGYLKTIDSSIKRINSASNKV